MNTVIGYKVEDAKYNAPRPHHLSITVRSNDGLEKVYSVGHYTTVKGAEKAGQRRIDKNSIYI